MIAVSFAELVEHVAFEAGVNAIAVVGPSQRADAVRARASVVWLDRHLRGGRPRGTGRALGRCAASAARSYRQAEALLATDSDFCRTTEAARAALTTLAADRGGRR